MDLQEQMEKLRQNKALADQLMRSADGQRLLALLTRDGGAQLQQATEQAAHGNTADMVHMIAELMRSKEGSALVHSIHDQIK